MTSFVFRETLMSHLLLWGNAYAQIVRNGRGQAVRFIPYSRTRWRSAEHQMVSWSTPITVRRMKVADPKGGYVTLRKDEVLHIPGLRF